jgi:hypothetical protein
MPLLVPEYDGDLLPFLVCDRISSIIFLLFFACLTISGELEGGVSARAVPALRALDDEDCFCSRALGDFGFGFRNKVAESTALSGEFAGA